MVPAATVAEQLWLPAVGLHSDIADLRTAQLALGSAEHGDSAVQIVAQELADMTEAEVPEVAAAAAGGAVVGQEHAAVGMAPGHTAATAEVGAGFGAVNIPADTETTCNTAGVALVAEGALPAVGSTAVDEREDAVGAEAWVAVAGSLCCSCRNVVLASWNTEGYLAVSSSPASASYVGEEPVAEPGKGHRDQEVSCRWPAAGLDTGVDRQVSLFTAVELAVLMVLLEV